MRSRYPQESLTRIMKLFGRTRQAFYDRKKALGCVGLQTDKIVELVKGVRQRMPKLGGRKLLYILADAFRSNNIKIGRDKLYDILRDEGLLIGKRRKGNRTTQSKHWYRKYTNLIKDMEINSSNQVWVSDITYIGTGSGFSYLSLITDAYSKKILGYNVNRTLEAEGCHIALMDALKSCKFTNGIIHHSDRGIQYCSYGYVETLLKHGMYISMTEDGNVYENAIAERINGILKEEFMIGEGFKNHDEARKCIDEAISIYNNERPHLSFGMLTPEQAHIIEGPLRRMWKSYPQRIGNNINDLK